MQKLRSFIALLGILVFTQNVVAQNYVNLKAGIGIPELAGVSVGLQPGPLQMMIGAGSLPLPDDKLFSMYGDLFFHLFGTSKNSEIKPWFLRFGIKYFREDTPRWIDRYTYADIRVGRSFFFTEQLSLELDLGTALELSYTREEIIPTTPWLNLEFPVLPSIGTRIVYRLPIPEPK